MAEVSTHGNGKKSRSGRPKTKKNEMEPLPNTRLAWLYQNPLFSDIIVKCEDVETPCHRAVLGSVPFLLNAMQTQIDNKEKSSVSRDGVKDKSKKEEPRPTITKLALNLLASSSDVLLRWAYQMPLKLERFELKGLFDLIEELGGMLCTDLINEIWSIVESKVNGKRPEVGSFDYYITYAALHKLSISKVGMNTSWSVLGALNNESI